jgi:NH3-dependent NAD+ synthetase
MLSGSAVVIPAVWGVSGVIKSLVTLSLLLHAIVPRFCALRVICLAVSMPKTPNGHKRPADVVANAVHVMKIATGEIEEELTEDGKSKAAVELGRKGGLARAKTVKRADRIKIAKKAANARWKRPR